MDTFHSPPQTSLNPFNPPKTHHPPPKKTKKVREVMDTFRVAARLGSDSLGAYVISMAQKASDVLAVELLQKEARAQVQGLTAGFDRGLSAGC
jgi:phosphoenolpyruvate carboxylase